MVNKRTRTTTSCHAQARPGRGGEEDQARSSVVVDP
jgi:hypothetical protein